jgi:flavin reductase (DIM6/NTAB) family NADH-FMN oxidoreductase RutF
MAQSLLKATRLIPSSVVLLTAGNKESHDAMTATAMFVAEKVPLITISLSKKSTCHELIEKTGECALNVASVEQVDLARKLGATHGKAKDKFRAFGIKTEKATKISVPLIAGSYANLECMVLTSYPASNYIVYLVEVVAFKANEKLAPIAWLKDRYFSVDREAR